ESHESARKSMKKPSARLPAQPRKTPTAPPSLSAVPPTEIDGLRRKIDDLDAQIVALINARAINAQKIGALKARDGVKPYSSSRELQVYKKVASQNKGPLRDEAMRAIYREIMSATIALERPTR